MDRETSKIERCIAMALCVALFLLVAYRIALTIIHFDINNCYSSWGISEYMINYQGGFVRRGIIGELLYQIFQIHPYPLSTVVLWFDICVFAIFIIVAFYVFYKKHWLPIMPLAILVYGILGYRRDFLMMLFAFAVYYFMFQYIKKRRKTFLIYSVLLSSISIFIYEPSFFFIVPISMLLYWNSLEQKSILSNTLKVLKVFILPLFCMGIVCTAKGSKEIADIIWNSWQPLFDYQGITCENIGASVAFLGMSTSDAVTMHLGYNYGIGINERYGFDPLVVSGSLLMFIGIYFLIIKTPSLTHNTKESQILLSDMYIFQFICLLPMFTILSCDFGRTINYVVYTTYFLVYFSEKYQVKNDLHMISKFSNRVCGFFDNRVMSSLWFYIIVLMLMPLGYILRCYSFIPSWPSWQRIHLIVFPKLQSLFSIFGL